MSRDLPERANLEHLRKQAKALLHDVQRGDPEAVRRLADTSRRRGPRAPTLADAQHAIAREHGFSNWAALRAQLESSAPAVDPAAALARAVRDDDVDEAAALLARHRELAPRLNEPLPHGTFGELPLAALVRRKQLAMIDLFLRHGADINGRSHWWAGGFGVLEGCEPEMAPFLIERGAVVGAHAAARLGMLDALGALLAADPSAVHARGGDGQTPLHYASTVDVARLLVARGADVDARDVDHESTPVQWMARERQEVARFLVERGCRTDVLLAAALGDVERVRRHLDDDPAAVRTRVTPEYFPMRDPRAGGTIYIWTLGRNRTPHAVAREFGHDDVLRLLMERSPDEVRLAAACEAGDDALAASLLARRPELVRTLPAAERRRIVDAAQENDAAAVRRMLAAGWPVDARGDEGATALHFAAWLGNAELVRELVRGGAPLELRDTSFHGTPLTWTLHGSKNSWRCREGDYAGVMEALLAAGVAAPPLTPEVTAPDAVMEVLRRHAARG
jgi:ankyrin repeat protein